MPAPQYFDEKRYSYHILSWQPPRFGDYQQASPETRFELQVQNAFVQANNYLRNEEYYLALDGFRQLQNLILTTVHPTLPVDAYLNPILDFPRDASLVDVFAAKAGTLLATLPLKTYLFPSAAVSASAQFPATVAKTISIGETGGVQIDARRAKLLDTIHQAGALAAKGDWTNAAKTFNDALQLAPADDKVARASILHDLAIANEKTGAPTATAVQFATQSADLFSQAQIFDANAEALRTVAGIQSRGGDQASAMRSLTAAEQVEQTHHLFTVGIPRQTFETKSLVTTKVLTSPTRLQAPLTAGIAAAAAAAAPAATAAAPAAAAPAATLMLDQFIATQQPARTFSIAGLKDSASISLTGDVTANTKLFLQKLSNTTDLGLLSGIYFSYVEIVAYLPSMYFYVIPMAIGDCLLGLGSYQEAESSYTSTLAYPFINKAYEIPKLWHKLATVYLEMGDTSYRNAKDSVADFGAGKTVYEKIIKTDKTLDAASPLYADARFANIKSRVQAFIAGGMKPDTNDNPQILAPVLEASLKLQQIALSYNFFGFPANYVPPFSWEYLQNTAKYFAQQASQIEQRYIQFKTAAENETLQREQLNQQAEVARRTVELEKRGLAEAQAGVGVARASLNYATVQHNNALQAQSQFAAVREQLYEYAQEEAWASAASVGQDDEVQLTITGFNYYNVSGKRRSLVLQDLAARRTKITNALEAGRLQRDVASSAAYMGVAQAELAQANARVNIANQRIAIAQLQQRDAQENRDFLDMKEFSAKLWFDLARSARRLSQKYLDLAIEIAFLSERAYNAETERGLSVIRFDYRHSTTDNLMGADYLLLDLDYFTFDHVTTTKTKKAPVKRVISLADSFPTAFQNLINTGSCNFQTELAMFDRQAPGLYLCKVQNVELVFVGISVDTLAGTLRNVGVSKFRDSAGNVVTRLYPADVMPLSRYDLRQDALAFRVNPNDLRLFENNGIDTLWQIDLPLSANDFDYSQILDVQLVLYYDGLFDPALETKIQATLPAGGSATRVFSLSLSYPDELFYLKSNGEAQISFDASMLPFDQKNMTRRKVSMKLTGDASVKGLKLHVLSQNAGGDLLVTTDSNGEVAGSAAGQPLFPLTGKPLFDPWTLRITAADNPALVSGGKLSLKGLANVMIFFEYDFQYR